MAKRLSEEIEEALRANLDSTGLPLIPLAMDMADWLAAARALEAEVRRLADAIIAAEGAIRHDEWCDYQQKIGGACNCSQERAVAALDVYPAEQAKAEEG